MLYELISLKNLIFHVIIGLIAPKRAKRAVGGFLIKTRLMVLLCCVVMVMMRVVTVVLWGSNTQVPNLDLSVTYISYICFFCAIR